MRRTSFTASHQSSNQARPNSVLSSWNESIHFCQWQGITCGRRHQRVTGLHLHSQQLAGSISPYVGNLSFLKELILSNNSFTNEMPPQIGQMRRLQSLILANNSLSGEIPANISSCFNLIEIHLGGNKLVGKIPNTLGSLSKLEKLGLYKSFLTGTMPPSFGNLSFLVSFVALENFLNGSIPESLGQSTSLNLFLVGENMLFGAVPASIFNISTLTALDLRGNQIQGSLPLDMFKTLPNLQIINLGLNQFITGSIPVSSIVSRNSTLALIILEVGKRVNSTSSDLTNPTELGLVDICNNKFGGKLPTSIGNLSTTLVGIDGSDLEGSIPPSLEQCRKLLLFKLSQNKLSGSITQQVWGLSSLSVVLNLSRNHLTGSVPMESWKCERCLHYIQPSVSCTKTTSIRANTPSSLPKEDTLPKQQPPAEAPHCRSSQATEPNPRTHIVATATCTKSHIETLCKTPTFTPL
ncbi:hypothetical protein L3X38_026030 [Prunus dulcis]|uniref:Leucine-rich repeat-containing N-terminal plant-type domain-containing protein n=1 Tax=Prunus dulcis TaxID=3755 RepID=A0AAD4W5E5_PRUDU|nr:hypothetical protein L3X38_026030 [Prunus dulcis]